MTQRHPSPSSSSDGSEEGNNTTISSPRASQFEARPRTVSRPSLFRGFGNSDSHANAPPPMPVVCLKSVRFKSSPSAKPFGDDAKSSSLRPKRSRAENSDSQGKKKKRRKGGTDGIAENSDSQGKKKKRRKGGTDGEVEVIKKMTRASRDDDQKKALWTEENEIALLRGLVAFIRHKGPTNDVPRFLRTISDWLHVDVEELELLDKVENLKKKYEKKAEKASDGKELVFKTPHAQKVYEISRDIWGGEGDKERDDENQKTFGEEDANIVVKDDVGKEVLQNRPRLFISERRKVSGASLGGMINYDGNFYSRKVIDKLLLSIEPPKGKNLAEIEDEVCEKALEAYINWLDYRVRSTKLALKAFRRKNSKKAKN